MIVPKFMINSFFFVINRIRTFFYRFKFKIGKNSYILGKVYCIGNDIEIGNNSSVNPGVVLNALGKVRIGSYVHISHFAQLQTQGLVLKDKYDNRRHYSSPIIIEDGAWICSNVVITPGITVGEGSVVAAGSVVTKDIPKFELWGGVPAKKIKDLK